MSIGWVIAILSFSVCAIIKLNSWAHVDDRWVDSEDPDWTTGI